MEEAYQEVQDYWPSTHYAYKVSVLSNKQISSVIFKPARLIINRKKTSPAVKLLTAHTFI